MQLGNLPPLGQNGKAIMMGLNVTRKPAEAATSSNFIANGGQTTGQQGLQELYTRAMQPANVSGEQSGAGGMVNTKA